MTTLLTLSPKIGAAGDVHNDVPVYLGYKDVAHLANVSPGAIRFYYYEDCKRGTPHLMAKPDILLTRGLEVLPGWTVDSVKGWLANRLGPGNSTAGDDRKGGAIKDPATDLPTTELPPVDA